MYVALPFRCLTCFTMWIAAAWIVVDAASAQTVEPPRFRRAGGGEVPATVQTSLVRFNDAFNRACERRDPDAILALYDPGVEWLAPDKAPVTGLDAPRASYQALFAQTGARLAHEFVSATVSSDSSLATMRGFYVFRPSPDALPVRGNFVLCLLATSDGWMILTDIFQAPPTQP